jgi:hypothetical protein
MIKLKKPDWNKEANKILKKFINLDTIKPGLTLNEEGNYIIKSLKRMFNKGMQYQVDTIIKRKMKNKQI